MNSSCQIKVKIIGFPQLKNLSIEDEKIETDSLPLTFGQFLNHLKTKYGAPVEKAIIGKKGVLNTVQVLKNEAEWIEREDLEHQLEDGDTISFIFMMAGG